MDERVVDINMSNRDLDISRKGVQLIKRFEALRLKTYADVAGILTIGYGHTGRDVSPGLVITAAEAEGLLVRDLSSFVLAVDEAVTPSLNQHQFDALVSFTYNVGAGAFKRSTLLKLLNGGQYPQAAAQFEKWVKAGGKVVEGLVRRRKAERKLFETGIYA